MYKEWYLGGEMNEGEKCYSYLCIRVIGYEGEVGFICIMWRGKREEFSI